MTENEINIEGFKLVELLSCEKFKSHRTAKEEDKDLIGIPEILDLGEVESFKMTAQDFDGSTSFVFLCKDGKKVGLDVENYKHLKSLAYALLEKPYIGDHADIEFIEKSCFDWIIDIYQTK